MCVCMCVCVDLQRHAARLLAGLAVAEANRPAIIQGGALKAVFEMAKSSSTEGPAVSLLISPPPPHLPPPTPLTLG